MDERTSRIFFGLCLLVLVWIGVYWAWQPTREQGPTITFETRPDEQPPENTGESSSSFDELNGSESGPTTVESSNPIEPPLARVELIPPEFTEHIVAPNELMQTIAKRYYGSIDDWTIIAKANPRVDPKKLRPGMVLLIPKDKDNIQGKLVGEDTPPGVITTHHETESKVIEYVVRPGDSLSVISQRIYGSSRHARFIYESNRDILRSMDAISVGQLLRLPPLAQDDSAPGG
jgi:LysM repeat protein